MTKSAMMSCIVGSALLIATNAGAAEHTLMPAPGTVHIGYFLASLKPVLTIDSGDIVNLTSVAAIVPSVIDQSGVVPPAPSRNTSATSTAR